MLTRREFIGATAAGLGVAGGRVGAADAAQSAVPGPLRGRIEGLMYGTFIGDALGGPIEFQALDAVAKLPDPPRRWRNGEKLDAGAVAEARQRLERQWRPYSPLRPAPEPYAHWSVDAPAGTITDDSRHKLVLLHALRRSVTSGPLTEAGFARAFLEWADRPVVRARPGWSRLAEDWLTEWWFAARWVLGERDLARALPPERMWNGLATCCGQMSNLPLACVFAGAPGRAYEAAFRLSFHDNGWGRDLNAALVAGLAAALVLPAEMAPGEKWRRTVEAMRTTDPYGHGRIPWCTRSVDRWLGVAQRLVTAAQGEPALLFEGMEREFRETVKWEAQVPFVMVVAAFEIAGGDPLAALMLTLEWGHDTDSYAQVAGAFAGAMHGSGLFPAEWRRAVGERLAADYGVQAEQEIDLLMALNSQARIGTVVEGVGRV